MKKLYPYLYKLSSTRQLNKVAAIALCFGATTLLPGKLFAQAPIISYSSPHIFAENTVVTLAPASSNVATPTGAYGSGVVLGSGLTSSINDVAVDAAGNMYVNDIEGTGEVKKISADGSSTTIIGSGFLTQSAGVAVDQSGNVYVADQGVVWKIPASGTPVTYGTPVIINSSFIAPYAIAVDAAGFVYVTDVNAGGIYKMANDGSGKVRVDDGSFNNGSAIKVDIAGNVYATDYVANKLYEIPVNTSAPVLLATGFRFPRGLAVDAAGTIYVDDETANGIFSVPAGGGTPVAVVTGLSHLVGLAVDASYNLYGALQGSGGISKFSPTGGYFISPALPPGLAINATSGVISGTPTTAFGPTAYTVSAFNTSGGDVDTVTMSAGPPPVISYGTAQTYTAGTAISALAPSPSGATVSMPGYTSTPTTVSWGFGSPAGVALDAAGNIYVADKFNNAILKIPPGGGNPTTITASFSSPTGVAVDKLGTIYVADSQNGVVKQISSDFLTVNTVGSGFIDPVSVALDPTGNLFIADAGIGGGSGAIYEIEKATGKQSMFVDGFEDVSGLATDAAGNVYVTDEGTGSLLKFTARSNLSLEFAFTFNFPTGVAVDPSGNIFVSDGLGPQVYEIAMGNGVPTPIGSGFGFPAGVVVDGAGNVYATDAGPNVLYEVSPTGGYYVNQPLPRGLKLNDTTGVITGTTKVVSAATDYFVTAYASGVPGTAARVNIAVNAAAPPAISFSGAQTYTTGMAITPLSPANTGGPVAAIGYSDMLTPLGSGFSHPAGTAVDSHGNVYVADNLHNLVMKIPAGGGTPVSIGGSFSAPAAVAVDSTGNVYVADEGNSRIVEIPAGGGSNMILGSGFVAPNGVAVDLSGNVFVTDESPAEAVYEIPAGNGPVATLTSGLIHLTGIAVDASDNVYFSDGGDGLQTGTVYKHPLNGGIESTVEAFFDYPTGVAVDAMGNVYFADQGPNVIYRVPANNSGQFTVIAELNNPEGIAVDPYGNLYIADTDNNDVEELSPAGGYFINQPLPSGLSMSSLPGTISGTPVTTSATTKYIVSAYNTGGLSQAAVNITVNLPPPPVISYATPPVFVKNIAIVPVVPTSENIEVPAYSPASNAFGSGIAFPYATAVDQSGNVYIADPTASSIYEILAGGPQITIGTNLQGPVGVAVDKHGNVYVANGGNNTLVEIHAHTGVQTYKGGGYHGLSAVAVDSAGNVFVADLQGAGGVIYKVDPESNKHFFKGGFSYPDGIAVDAAGNVYVSDGGSGPPSRVYKISPDGNTITHFHRFFYEAGGVAIDATGNLFISDAVGEIIEYPGGGSSSITFTAGLVTPFGLSADGAGNLYVADFGTNNVKKLTPTGGYFVNRVLPQGLSLDGTTGAISGTPTAESPAKNYVVSAYNAAGGTTAALSITVASSNDLLSSLTVSQGAFSPGFSSGTHSYTDEVGNLVSSIMVTPTTADPNATILINGTDVVTSGTASDPVTLHVGSNTINVAVTAQDGTTTQTYTVTVNRQGSGNNDLSSLVISKGAFSPGFSSGIHSYTDAVGSPVNTVMVTPTTADPTATILVNGTDAVTSGTASDPITLNTGPNTITVAVKAQNGVTKTYTIIVTRAISVNNDLSSLVMSQGAFSPGFSSGNHSYTDAVGSPVGSVTVTPTTADPTATILVNGTDAVTSGTASDPITLGVGSTTIDVAVKAQSGVTKTYTVTVNRAPSGNNDLSSLEISQGVFSPGFSSGTHSYTDAVGNPVGTVTVTPTTADPTATILVNGTDAVTSGTASDPITLGVGSTTIDVAVKAQNGITKTYTVTVTRAASDNNDLSSLVMSKGVFSPGFSSGTHSYTDAVGNPVSTVTVTPTTADPTATILVNGTDAVTSGTASDPITLVVGSTTIDVAVKAQNGVTKTYTVTVNRASGSDDGYDAGISVTKPTEIPTLAEDGIQVHQGISPNGDGINDFLQIDNISQYPENKLSIMNRNGQLIYEASGYDNSSKVFDGHSNKNGEMQLPGTYFYQLDYTVSGIARHKTGFIVLKY